MLLKNNGRFGLWFGLWVALMVFLSAPGMGASETDVEEDMMLRQVDFTDATVATIFQRIVNETGVRMKIRARAEVRAQWPRFNMQFDAIPVSAVVRLVCADAKLEYRLEDGALVFFPAGTLKPARPVPAPKASGTTMSFDTVSSYPVGYKPPRLAVGPGVIVYCGPVPIFRRFRTGVTASARTAAASTPRSKAVAPPSRLDDPTEEARLAQMELRSFSAANLPFAQVIARLRGATAGLTPDHLRMNIYVRSGIRPDANLTFNFDRVSVGEALKYICAAAGVNHRIEKWGVVIY